MNCEVTNLPVLEVENHQIREVLRCVLHTILFSRALGLVQPKDVDSELFNITYVQCGEKDLERKVEERINQFCDWVDKHPGVKRGEVCISFYEKRYKQIWFSKQEERLYWEQWRIHLDITRMDASRGGSFDQRAGGEPGAAQAALERDLENALTFILKVVNEKKDHIPPVTCSDVLSFPYEISIPGEGESSFGKNLMKRMMEVSPPPMLG